MAHERGGQWTVHTHSLDLSLAYTLYSILAVAGTNNVSNVADHFLPLNVLGSQEWWHRKSAREYSRLLCNVVECCPDCLFHRGHVAPLWYVKGHLGSAVGRASALVPSSHLSVLSSFSFQTPNLLFSLSHSMCLVIIRPSATPSMVIPRCLCRMIVQSLLQSVPDA